MIRPGALFIVAVAALAAYQAGTLPMLLAQLVASAALLGASALVARSVQWTP